MDDFETNPVGTAKRVKKLEQQLADVQAEIEQLKAHKWKKPQLFYNDGIKRAIEIVLKRGAKVGGAIDPQLTAAEIYKEIKR